jgi:hypothetical protein
MKAINQSIQVFDEEVKLFEEIFKSKTTMGQPI